MTIITPEGERDLRTVKAPLWRKIGFAAGDFGYNFSWYLVGALLLVFYTDVFLIPTAVVSVFVLIIRLTDAVVDPIVGNMADRTRTRWGRYRPWILFAPIAMVIMMTLTFWAHPGWDETTKIIYAVVTFALLTLASTCVNMPYGGLNAVVSLNTDERVSFSSYRMVASSLGGTIAGFIIFPMIAFFSGPDNDTARGYVTAVPIIGIISVALFIFCFLSTKELVQPRDGVKPAFKTVLKAVGRNKPLQLVIAGCFVFGFLMYGRIAIMAYYFQYNVGDMGMFGTYNLVATGATIIGAIVATFVLRLFRGGNKAHVIVLSCIIQATFFGLSFLVIHDMTLFFLFGGIAGIGTGIFNAMLFAILPDTVEYGELRSGIRTEGFNYALFSLAVKWGGAAGPAALGLILAATGYTPNVAQNDGTLNAIALMMTVVPGVLVLLAAVPFMFYRINRARYNEIVDELQQRHELAPAHELPDGTIEAPTPRN